MDNLVLTAVAPALANGLRGAQFDGFRRQSPDRFVLLWDCEGQSRSTAISMRPESPWVGRPAVRIPSKNVVQTAFDAQVRKSLHGAILHDVVKPGADRSVEFIFSDRRRLVLELAVHGANIVLVDANGNVEECLRRPAASRERLGQGQPFLHPRPPARLLNPFTATATEIDLSLQDEPDNVEALRKNVFGVGTPAAKLVCEESWAQGLSPGQVLVAKFGKAMLSPVVEAAADPLMLAQEGRFDFERERLWPWKPLREPAKGCQWWSADDAAETAGRWYEAIDLVRRNDARLRSLVAIVRRERAKTSQAMRRVERDLARFEDPKKFKDWGEAILAGLSNAVRLGPAVTVPNPHDADGSDLVIPVPPGVPLPKVAETFFGKHRRALRGLERARLRHEELQRHQLELDGLLEAELEEEDLLTRMKALRLAVALEPETRSGRQAAASRPARLEGVRVYHASSGEMILAGKGAKENHRLTFKLAAAHDFWLHAQGVTGAHVILRNDTRGPRPGSALEQAAAVAAFHSEAGRDEWVDVQWTLRKNVKKPRGAVKGTVVVKRFATLRVRPGIPKDLG